MVGVCRDSRMTFASTEMCTASTARLAMLFQCLWHTHWVGSLGPPLMRQLRGKPKPCLQRRCEVSLAHECGVLFGHGPRYGEKESPSGFHVLTCMASYHSHVDAWVAAGTHGQGGNGSFVCPLNKFCKSIPAGSRAVGCCMGRLVVGLAVQPQPQLSVRSFAPLSSIVFQAWELPVLKIPATPTICVSALYKC